MTEQPQAERSIFLAAIEIGSACERAAYVERACDGNSALRAKVDALLQAHERPQRLLDQPYAGTATVDDMSLREQPGTVIGPYKLMEQIGEGGMGLVFVAEQQQPVRRKVALKVIKPGMDSRAVIARFEAERQALALMDHPNIAKVYDGGETASGRPYFVMELVKGVPITDFCDQNQVPIRERLEMFLHVCQAVQHAHQKGIIHRDIKPSNVLIMSQDGTPVPKVIDFGIAKAIGQQLTDKTIYTQFTQLVGTPLYMSPEQAGHSGVDVDTRTDIYALGVLLYELLTGTTPFDKERLKDAGYDEIRRIIREEEAARPSTRVSTMGEAAATVSANRGSDPRRLSQLFRGELDWVVMRALEKDRNRRYESASALAADVQRYLHDEPVLACPPTVGYMLRKFVRRNKGALATAALLVVMLLVAGGAVVASALWAASQAEARAQVEADAKKELEFNLYLRNISLAQAEASVFNWGAVEDLLQECPEHLRGWEWNYLKRLPDGPWRDVTAEVTAGVSANLALAFHPNGEILAGPGPGKTVTVWDLTTGVKTPLPGHSGQVRCLAFQPPNGDLLATAGQDGLVRFWDPATGKPVRDIAKAHGGQSVDGLTFSPDGRLLASIGADQKVRLWDVVTGKQRYEFATVYREEATGSLGRAVFSPNGRLFAYGGPGNTVKVWDVANGREKMSLEDHENLVHAVAFSPQGDRLVSVIWGSVAKVWDLAAGGRELFSFRFAGWAWSVQFSPDGNLLAAGGNVDDPVVKLYDARTGRLVRLLEGHADRVNCLAFHPDGRRLASCSSDKTVRIWDLDRGREVLTLRGHAEAVTSLLFDAKGWRLASSSWDGTLRVWDGTPSGAAPGRRCVNLRGHTDKVFSVGFSPDGRQLVSAGQDRTVRLWDVAGAREIRTLVGHTETVFAAALGRDGLLVSGSFDWTVRIWDARTGALIHTQHGPEAQARSLALSADGRFLVTSSIASPFELWLWDVRHAAKGPRLDKRRLPLEEHNGPAFGVAFSPDAKYVATAGVDGKVIVSDAATGRKLIAWERPGNRVRPWAVAFHPDGRHLAAGYSGKDLLIWDWADPKKEPVVLPGPTEPGHTEDIHNVAYSPDGRWLASASWHEVIIWDAATHKEVRRLGGFPGLIWSVAWSPGPERLLAVGGGRAHFGLVELWDMTDLSQKGGADEPDR
jgi:WD40 repeat protein/serine/threonine protein kinase